VKGGIVRTENNQDLLLRSKFVTASLTSVSLTDAANGVVRVHKLAVVEARVQHLPMIASFALHLNLAARVVDVARLRLSLCYRWHRRHSERRRFRARKRLAQLGERARAHQLGCGVRIIVVVDVVFVAVADGVVTRSTLSDNGVQLREVEATHDWRALHRV
jgi:hypothetical protein